MRDRLRIVIAGAVLLATALAIALATTAASASAQSTFRETGSVTIGTSLVWIRGTNAGVVQLFVGRGFHDAFARAHEVDATTLQRWVDSVRALAPVRSSDSAADDSQMRASVLSSEVTMMRRVGGPFSGLRLLVSGEDPIAMPELTAREFLVVLDSAARVAKEMSAPASPSTPAVTVAAVAAPVVTAPVVTAPVVTAPVVVAPPAPVSPAPVAPAPVEVPPPAPAPAPELVLPAPSAPVVLLASRVEIMPLPLPDVPAPAAPPAVVAPAPDTVVTPHVDVPADKLIRTPLGPFTIPGALLADRDKETQYCYTQLGLKYNPDLKGEITVKLSLGVDGAVQEAVVTKRNWQGISAGEVEACVRALAHDWSFPASDPTIADGAKLLTFSFTP
jgi:hypothetical protein